MSDLSTNFVLKDGETITIDNNDVRRIRMFNDIVWEKRRQTLIEMTASPERIMYNDTYILQATVQRCVRMCRKSPKEGGVWELAKNVPVEFYDITTSGTKKLIATAYTNNSGVAQCMLHADKVENKIYKAVYNQNDIYDASETPITIIIEPKTTKISVFDKGNSDTVTIYRGQYAGIKLLDIDGNALPGQKITITANGVNYTKVTDEYGVAKLRINLNAGEYPITYCYNGAENYAPTTITETYIVNDLKYYELTNRDPAGIIGASSDAQINGYQRWEKRTNQQYYCYKFVEEYNTGNTINPVGKPRHRPHRLRISFNKPSGMDTINYVHLHFHTFMGAAVGSDAAHYYAEHVVGQPNINLYIDDTKVETEIGSDAYLARTGGYAADDDFIWTYNKKNINKTISIEFDYPSSMSSREGFLAVEGISFTIGHSPKQTTQFE